MKNKNLSIGIVIAVLVIAVGFIAWKAHEASAPVAAALDTTGDNTTPVSTEDTTGGSIDSGTAVSLSYTEALAKYADARVQLDSLCQADAQNQKMTFKNNSYLMVDNRSAVTRTVHIGSVFTIKPYGFKIIQLSSAKLPVTWLVDCGTSQNVATITIQK